MKLGIARPAMTGQSTKRVTVRDDALAGMAQRRAVRARARAGPRLGPQRVDAQMSWVQASIPRL
jgi:hypothetical protein